MKKINNKGFALVETLIVTAFVVGIFSVMYANFYPMMGEYEKRENYDDISSIYNANLFKMLIERIRETDGDLRSEIERVTTGHNIEQECTYETVSPGLTIPHCNDITEHKDYVTIDEESFSKEENKEYYVTLTTQLNVEKIYLLPYNIEKFKDTVKNSSEFDTQTKEYIDYLPDYKNNPYDLRCRIIVKYKAGENREIEKDNSEYKFATIGVGCK